MTGEVAVTEEAQKKNTPVLRSCIPPFPRKVLEYED
jgi:hypothetical protein